MFDIGWSELLVIATVAIIVVGPKDLPRMLRTLGKSVGKLRHMANDFRSQFDDAMRDSELEELRSSINELKDSNPLDDIDDPFSDEFDTINRVAKEPLTDKSAKDGSDSSPAKPGQDSAMADEEVVNAAVEPLPQRSAENAEPEPEVLGGTPPGRTAAGEKSGA
jgi:sec-independent protein translocase protein TatB